MIEAISEFDDKLFEKFIEGQAVSNDEIRAGLRKATIALKIFPVICGTAFKNKGVQTMLDAVVDYLPSPLDVPPIEGVDIDDPEKVLIRHASDKEPFAALVFKIMTDPYVGPTGVFPGVFGDAEDRAIRFSTWPSRARSGSAACCACTPTSARRSRKSWRAISAPPWGCGPCPRATRSATTSTPSCWNPSISRCR